MQRRILLVAITAVALAVTVLGVPLAFVQKELLRAQQEGNLLDEAVRIAVVLPRNLRETGGKPEIPDDVEGMHVAVYDGEGRLLTGDGPPEPDEIVLEAMDGKPAHGFAGDDLVAAVPVLRGEDTVAVVRTSSRRGELRERELLTFGAIGGVAVFASLMALLLAVRLAVRLAAPIRDLQQAAEELGDGNFAVQAPASGIGELDAVARSMNVTAQRLGQLVDRERAFASHASHQLRTPLTALRLRLDTALHGDPRDLYPAVTESMAIVNDLEATVHDLLAVSLGRTTEIADLDLDALLAGLPHRWQGLLEAEGRRLVIRQDDPPVATGRAGTVRQVLDVLLDNAYRHGGGTVQVVARDASGALAIDVVDEGRPGESEQVDERFGRVPSAGRSGSAHRSGPLDLRTPGSPAAGGAPAGPGTVPFGVPLRPPAGPPAPVTRRGARGRGGPRSGGTGIGLGLARTLLVADGGRLLLTSSPGRTCATVLLPAAEGA